MHRKTGWRSLVIGLTAWTGVAWSGLLWASTTNWESSFPSASAEYVYDHRETGLFTGYGQVYAGMAQAPAPVARIDVATGTASWSAATSGQVSAARMIALPLKDGGAIIVTDVLSRRDHAGAQLWKVSLPTSVVAAALLPSGDVIVAVNGTSGAIYQVFDDADGHLLESLDLSRFGNGSCQASQLAVTQSALYALNRCTIGTSTGALIKLAYSPLRIEWSRPNAISGEFLISFWSMLAANADSIYVSSSTALGRINPVDGSLIWQHTGNEAITQLRSGDDGSALIARAGSIEKHLAANGETAWTHIGLDEIHALTTSGDSVVIGGNSGTSNSQAGYIAHIGLADGGLVWRRAATEPSGGTSSVRHAAIQGDAVIALGSGCKAAPSDRCIAHLWRTPLAASGAVTSSPFASTLDVMGNAIEDGDAHTLAATIEWIGDAVQIRVRQIRNNDGSVSWEATLPIMAFTRWDIPNGLHVIRSGDGHVVVAAVHEASTGFEVYGRLSLTKLDAVNGNIIWSRSSFDPTGFGIVSSAPASDSAGHLYLGTQDADTLGQTRRSIRKLDRASGIELWRHDLPACMSCNSYSPPAVELAGNGVMVSPRDDQPYSLPWSRLDSITGNVIWSSSALTSKLFRLDANHALAATSANGQFSLRRIELGTGNVVANATYSYPGDTGYAITAAEQRADGVVFVSADRYAFEGQAQVRNSLLLRLAAAGTSIDWAQRMTSGPISTTFSWARINALGNSTIYVSEGYWGNSEVSEQFLTRIDAESGALIDSQLLHFYFIKQPSRIKSRYNIQRVAEGMPLITYSQKYWPDQAMTWRVSGRAAPDATVTGALSVNLVVHQGTIGSVQPFIYTTSNVGSTNANDVEALLQIPANARLIDATCQLDGAACPLQTSASLLSSTQPMPAGSRMVISGTLIRVPGSADEALLQAASFAPYGFSEIDMKDNRATVTLFGTLFANGFD